MYKIYNFVSTYNLPILSKIPDPLPIEVGANLRDTFIYELKDNIGDNISSENEYYGELTALYWIWKNFNFEDDAVISFNHYNKFLKLNSKDVIYYFRECNFKWVVCNEIDMPKHSDIEEWEVLVGVIKDYFPDYLTTFNAIVLEDGSSKLCNPMNMFITTKVEMDDYCSFLFSVLGKVRERIGDSDKKAGEKRYCAFFGERLLTLYLLHNGKKYKTITPYFSKHHIQIASKLIKYFPILKKFKIYYFFRKIFLKGSHFDSSYK